MQTLDSVMDWAAANPSCAIIVLLLFLLFATLGVMRFLEYRNPLLDDE